MFADLERVPLTLSEQGVSEWQWLERLNEYADMEKLSESSVVLLRDQIAAIHTSAKSATQSLEKQFDDALKTLNKDQIIRLVHIDSKLKAFREDKCDALQSKLQRGILRFCDTLLQYSTKMLNPSNSEISQEKLTISGLLLTPSKSSKMIALSSRNTQTSMLILRIR